MVIDRSGAEIEPSRRMAIATLRTFSGLQAGPTQADRPWMDAQLDLERDLQGEAGRTPQMKQAIAAFFAQKRGG